VSAPKWYEQSYKSNLKGQNRRVLGPIEETMREDMILNNSHRDTEHLHPSEMSKDRWCIRQTWYKINGHSESNPENLNLRRINILAEGNNIHDKWQNWMRRAGILAGNWKCLICHHKWWQDSSPVICPECEADGHLIRYAEVAVEDKAHRIIGHADGMVIDERGKALIEIKSVGLGTIRWDAPKLYELYESGAADLDELWKRIKRPLTTHLRQINLYMHCTGIHDAVVIYEWKPTQEVKEFQIKFDPLIVEEMLDKADDLIEHLDAGTLPPRIDNAMKSKMPCVFCSYKSTCFDSPVSVGFTA
jgi:hypothetical protein